MILHLGAGPLGRLWSLIFIRFVANSAWIPWRKIETTHYILCFLMLLHTISQILSQYRRQRSMVNNWIMIRKLSSEFYFQFGHRMTWNNCLEPLSVLFLCQTELQLSHRDPLKTNLLLCLLENFRQTLSPNPPK